MITLVCQPQMTRRKNLYVDAFFQRDADIIKVVERSNEGKRIFKEFPVRYTFYYPDPRGKYQSIYGEPLTRVIAKNSKDFRKEMAINNNKTLYALTEYMFPFIKSPLFIIQSGYDAF